MMPVDAVAVGSSGAPWNNVSDFRAVNGYAGHSAWLHPLAEANASYGVALFGVLVLFGWWLARRRGDSRGVATAVLTAFAALAAVAINQPIVHAVNEPRPFMTLPHVIVLVHHAADAGYPSDHATLAGAVAVGLLFLSRKLGLVGVALALLMALTRVYVGVHYPRDVVAGLLLGGVVSLVLVGGLRRPAAALVARLRSGPLRVLVTRQESQP